MRYALAPSQELVIASPSVPALVHRRRLLARRRCPHCAERLDARPFLTGDPCSHCGLAPQLQESVEHAASLLGTLERGWNATRWYAYAAVLVANLVVSWVPVATTAMTAVGMILANIVLIHRPSSWLPFQYRLIARSTIRVWFVAMIGVTFLINAVATPLIALSGLGIATSTVTALVITVLYVEGARMLLRRVVRRAIARPNGDWGWLVISGATVGAAGFVGTAAILYLWQAWVMWWI